MSKNFTTKDLTKNELDLSYIIAGLVVLVLVIVFLNFAQMDQKDLPEISFTAMPSQATDGSGLVSFGANIGKISAYDIKLKVEYTIDGETYFPVILAQADIDDGSLSLVGNETYQITEITFDSDSANLNFIWDAKATDQNISSEQVKNKITLAYKLKDESDETGPTEAVPQEDVPENSDVEIDETEASITQDVIIESNEPAADQAVAAIPIENEENILPPNIDELNTVTAAIIDAVSEEINSVPVEVKNAEDNWSELFIISDNFKIDNAGPEVISGQINLPKAQIYLSFSEAMNTDLAINNEQIKLQNENLSESSFDWLDNLTLVINLSAAEKEKYTASISDWILQITAENNFQDLAGNKFSGGLIALTKQEEVEVPEIKDEEEPEKEPEEELEKEPEEEKEGEIIIPQNNKIINTRGYNKNCSFDPNDFTMAAGETRQIGLSLVPRDVDSKYSLSVSSVPGDFEVKILQPVGIGSGPVNVDITAPVTAAPRLYKILLRYEDFLPDSVSYVNNCVLRLTVQ